MTERRYKCYKNKLTSILRFAEKEYYSKLLDQHRNNVKKTWQVLNEIIQKRNGCATVQEEFSLADGSKTTNRKQVSELFNNFFVNVGPSLASKIGTETTNVQIGDYLGASNVNSMVLTEVNEVELLNIVSDFTPKTSTDLNSFDMQSIKAVFPSITKPFAYICNLSLTQGVFPDQMKVAKVVPLFKSGRRDIVSNYRPVSILPQFSKILEKVFHRRLESFIERSHILNDCQYGFRKNSSTSLALIDFVENITDAIDRHEYTVGVFIDLKKAFDTVDHTILLQKLNHIGIRGVAYDWLANYLTNRKQYVLYNGTESSVKQIVCGVPQGAILAPLLFLLYINDLANVSNMVKLVLFADDTNLYMSGGNIEQLMMSLNRELVKLESWFKVNKLSLNVAKTNFMVFTNRSVSIPVVIKLCGLTIDRVNVTKFLGVLIDQSLNWKVHIEDLCLKLRKSTSIIFKASLVINSDACRTLYCTLFLPYITYCAEVWGNAYTTTLSRVIISQKRVIRVICKVPRGTSTTLLFKEQRLLKFDDIVRCKLCTMFYNVITSNVPRPILNRVCMFNSVRRNQRYFGVTYSRTELKKQCAMVIGPKVFNNLPSTVKSARTVRSFKHLFKVSILSTY